MIAFIVMRFSILKCSVGINLFKGHPKRGVDRHPFLQLKTFCGKTLDRRKAHALWRPCVTTSRFPRLLTCSFVTTGEEEFFELENFETEFESLEQCLKLQNPALYFANFL